jgi:acetyl-CoA carboxylase biotin carboxyl carrier protein
MDLTNEDVADILALLDSLPYDELDLQTSRFRLVLRRTPDGWTQSTETRSDPEVLAPPASGLTPASAPAEGAPASPPAGGSMVHRPGYNRVDGAFTRSASSADGAAEVEGTDGAVAGSGKVAGGAEGGAAGAGGAGGELVEVRAPLPGTFYRAPRPGAAPFVEVGSRVGAEDVVGIVETMKLMNSVIAGVDGTVAEICVGNAEFAANGATLLRIRAD